MLDDRGAGDLRIERRERGPPSWDDAPAPAQVARKALRAIGVEPPGKWIPFLTHAMHRAYGTGWGIVYTLARGKWTSGAIGERLAFGAAVWGASDAQLVPLGIYEPPWDYDVKQLVQDLGYHLAYEVGVVSAVDALRQMSLTVGTGPFSKSPAGRFNVAIDPPGATLFWDPVAYRVRGFFGGEAVVDSRSVMMLHETNHLPVWYFPEDHLRADLLEPSEKKTHCPHKGDATYRSIRVGDRVARDAIWAYRDPIESACFLAGYAAFVWRELDEWFVEDEQVQGHPRDPYSRIDVYETTRHVRVSIDGETVADTRRAHVLFETALPPRYYIPLEDVRSDLLVDSPTTTRCAYKGVASYWHVQLGDELHDDIVWTYRDPEREAEAVRDFVCFFNERVDLELDGELCERPRTQWSRD